MKRLLRTLWNGLSSRAVTPVVIGIFAFIYVVIAFGTDEALTVLMEFTRRSGILALLLALIPINGLIRLQKEVSGFIKRRRIRAGKPQDLPSELFDERVELPGSPSFSGVENRLVAAHYKFRTTENVMSAWRGIDSFPVKMVYLVGSFCFFAGILISLTTRQSERGMVVEGEPFPLATEEARVERIVLKDMPGPFLAKTLAIEVSSPNPGAGKRVFGLYPPSRTEGFFVYPRYLGIGLLVRLSTPDGGNYEKHSFLNIYPSGKEDSTEIPETPYRLTVSLAEPEDGKDLYVTGHMTFLFKLLKGKDLLFSGSAPVGGEFAHDGYRVAFPDFRRVVVTDFIMDYGVLMVWTALVLIIVVGIVWLPIRLFFPRREMYFVNRPEGTRALSRAEGGARKHNGVFHELLDHLDAQ